MFVGIAVVKILFTSSPPPAHHERPQAVLGVAGHGKAGGGVGRDDVGLLKGEDPREHLPGMDGRTHRERERHQPTLHTNEVEEKTSKPAAQWAARMSAS